MASNIQAWLDAVNTLREYLGYGYREYTETDTEETLRQELLILQLMAKQQGIEVPSPIATADVTPPQPANLIRGGETTSKSFPQIPSGLAPGAEAPTPSEPGIPNVISHGGYDWMWQEGFKDEPGAWMMIGQSQRGTSDYQREQLSLDRARVGREISAYDNQALDRQRDLLASALQFEGQRQGLRGQAREEDIYRQSQTDMARAFEDWRNRLENSPRNFFINQMIRQQANPFTPDPMTIGTEMAKASQDLKTINTSLKEAKQQLKDAYTRELDSGSPMDKATIAGLEKRFEDLSSEKQSAERWIQNYGQTGRVVGGTPEQQAAYEAEGRKLYEEELNAPEQQAQTPMYDIPKELQPLIGGSRLTGNQLVTNPLLTPSAQMFNRMSPTAREQLYGLHDVRETNPEDMLHSIQSMLPVKKKTTSYSAARQI